ncbi:acyl-CoA dehydrogenase family protein [Streptomyces sp. NPDC002523]
MPRETIADLLLDRVGDDRAGLRTRERTWSWDEVVRESAARASLARSLRIEGPGVALAAVQLGVAEGALRHAATYLTGRHQFGRPLATFQAVQHQLADCYIDIEAMRVTLWQAVTALEDGEDAERAVLVAKWWATDGGLNVVHRIQHVHGGMGVDTDYPVHRHFLWGKQISTTLGGAGADLSRLGAVLARETVAS